MLQGTYRYPELMIDQVNALISEFEDVEKRLADPEVVSDPKLLETLGRRHKELGNALSAGWPLQAAYENLETAKELMDCLLYTSPSPRDS